jgi:hypothetical protein
MSRAGLLCFPELIRWCTIYSQELRLKLCHKDSHVHSAKGLELRVGISSRGFSALKLCQNDFFIAIQTAALLQAQPFT